MSIMCASRPFPPKFLAAMVLSQASLGTDTKYTLDIDNLLTLDRQMNTVRFAHLSVREFLEKNHFSVVDANSIASHFCLSYLIKTIGWMLLTTKFEPVPTYVVLFWPEHVQKCLYQEKSAELPEMLVGVLRTISVRWFQTVAPMIQSLP